jgi:superfamily II DNA or RNA helicase
MGLIDRLSAGVSRKVQTRGREYHSAGVVSIRRSTADFIEAAVEGVRMYRVLIAREQDGVHVSCSCPYFDDWYEPCKHIWATLLSAQETGLLRSWESTLPKLIPEEPEAEDEFEEGEPYDDVKDERAFVERDLPASRQMREAALKEGSDRRAGMGAPAWKLAMQAIRQEMKAAWPARVSGLKDKQITYIVDAGLVLEIGPCVVVGARSLNKDGKWGRPKTISVGYDSISGLPDPADVRILGRLLGVPRGRYGGITQETVNIFRLPTGLSQELMAMMCETGRCMLRRPGSELLSTLQWDPGEPWEFRVEVRCQEEPPQYRAEGYLLRHGERIPLSEPVVLLRDGLMIAGGVVARYDHHDSFGWIRVLRRDGPMVFPEEHRQTWLEEVIRTQCLPPLDLPEELRFEESTLTPKPQLKIDRIAYSGHAGDFSADLAFDYEGELVNSHNPVPAIADVVHRRRIRRDREFEAAAVDHLRSAGFRSETDFAGQPRWRLAPGKLGAAVRRVLALGWNVEAEGRHFRRPGPLQINVSSGIDWFELRGDVDFEGQRTPFPRLLAALKKGESAVVLDDGTLGMIPEDWFRRYAILAGAGADGEDHVRFSRSQAGLLDAFLESQPQATCDAAFEQAREQLKRFVGIAAADATPGFCGQLRSYQRDGLGWLHFLREFGFGGCLADDMGLGKTVQVLALLETRRQSGARDSAGAVPPRPSLAVVPKSLVFNWKQEAARFTPEIRVLDHTGSLRVKAGEHLETYDLILTTYGTLRRDAHYLKDIEFDYVILDEAQTIKNAATASAKAVRLLRGKNRLALSGTPIENHLGELWSLVEFLNPGMLGSASVFQLGAGDLRNPDAETRKLLSRALRPFILRRTKEQVASDLPPKQEQFLYCELEAPQRRLYDELRDYYRRSLMERVDRDGIGRAKIQVLEALLRLRQAACHPGLIDRNRTEEASAKLDLVLPQIEEVLEEGHKILVFSQFTSFLAIVRNHLDREKVVYEYLDGETRDRSRPVERFQNDPDCRLFLISLKAGGLGLNLTAAEYVYLLDPWWNPAVERQAVDRTHRIGQTRPVFAYRVIARDTVEEKVLELQQTKQDLADAIISADSSLIRDLRREDLELLLE